MQWLAMLTMLIDHIGVVWFPEHYEFRMIGRLAFPIYAYLIVIGYHRTRNINRYMIRLAVLALISQIPFQLAFDTTDVNVIATLFICLLTLKMLDTKSIPLFIRFTLLAIVIVILEAIPFDYGAYALFLMLIYRYARNNMMIYFHFVLEIIFMIRKGWAFQFLSITITLLICQFQSVITMLDRVNVPRSLWRSFYPLHLLIIALMQFIFVY